MFKRQARVGLAHCEGRRTGAILIVSADQVNLDPFLMPGCYKVKAAMQA
jgi:hypothetical protein